MGFIKGLHRDSDVVVGAAADDAAAADDDDDDDEMRTCCQQLLVFENKHCCPSSNHDHCHHDHQNRKLRTCLQFQQRVQCEPNAHRFRTCVRVPCERNQQVANLRAVPTVTTQNAAKSTTSSAAGSRLALPVTLQPAQSSINQMAMSH